MTDLHDQPIAIVGGGAAGIATALAFASRGQRSRVFERAGNATAIDRGDILHPATLPLLRQWNAWDAVRDSKPLQFADFRIIDGDGRSLLTANTQKLLGADYRLTALRHPDIVHALHAAADATGLIERHDSEPVTELLTQRGRIRGVRTARDDYPAMLTVVAAGTRSKLRAQHFGGHQAIDYGTSFYNARVTALDNYRDCGYYVLDRAGLLVMVALPGDELRIGIQFRTHNRDDRPSPANFAAHARRILRPLRDEQLDFIDGHTYRLEGILARTWWTPGAVLVGDIAHTVHPTGGQGMNLAFQDADILAAQLTGTRGPDAIDDACRTYATIRHKHVRPVFRRAHLGGTAASFSHPATIGARRGLLRAVDHVAPLKRAAIRRLVEVR
ncbi:FAD-dependent monooxygenase [Amycolatopsis roodepoortensis]|uniref:FAD-dependent oxidoreductase n=1 Tax=Amycolatopsis roodepoortensis TaxID=700274 RepID=UPI00214B21C8|nr:NAD(P)/FAD-dependent oxidoreductase [Amycolatopsis roodepoortensis]UUV35879.1 FAD-dependent monooxygenase [Amycolatopsis roodepoortensis]